MSSDKTAHKSKGTPGRSVGGKHKSAGPGAKPAKTSASTGTTTRPRKNPRGSANPSQVMDFDTDDVAGQRLEPGLELIEGGPAKARHRSLVEPLKPGDSVVNRE